jgi:hypothetical protein
MFWKPDLRSFLVLALLMSPSSVLAQEQPHERVLVEAFGLRLGDRVEAATLEQQGYRNIIPYTHWNSRRGSLDRYVFLSLENLLPDRTLPRFGRVMEVKEIRDFRGRSWTATFQACRRALNAREGSIMREFPRLRRSPSSYPAPFPRAGVQLSEPGPPDSARRLVLECRGGDRNDPRAILTEQYLLSWDEGQR